LSFGTNVYEMANEIQTLLHVLSSSRKSVIFTGTYPQLQSVFHGGQGGSSDPMMPVVRHTPAMQMDPLIRFIISRNGRKSGGLSKSQEQDLFGLVQGSLSAVPRENRMRVLPALVNREIHRVLSSGNAAVKATGQYALSINGLAETLSGLSDKPRVGRFPHVQSHFTRVLTDPGLEDHLTERLLAQDEAISRLVSRLRMECLTRPPHQPLRYCSQGTPATGKSESAILLAGRLGVPYINIDAASIPDFYTASAQLLGSGRGIVGSYQSGRLEQAAKHHSGALVEVSDLDHAPAQVRSALADLFLQVLETGEAQSAAGAMFSCANIIFAFTINLPNGMDETVRKRFGFQEGPTERDIRRSVTSEIKTLFSSAFLSRIGTPILFKPLDGEALAVIVDRAVRASVLSAASRLDWEMAEVMVEKGVGKAVVDNIEANILAFGARGLLEEARTLAAEALMELQKKGGTPSGRSWSVGVEKPFRLVIREKKKRS
ncbi:ATP-dependent Clp protease ATP-binding subunit, partial [bacterium]|nr:ATP-dependent Clp protease ATP-binding subunit [bacterium]